MIQFSHQVAYYKPKAGSAGLAISATVGFAPTSGSRASVDFSVALI